MKPQHSPIWHPFTQHGLNQKMPLISNGHGAYLFTDDDQRFIDAISSWWVITHGHCHPRIQKAIQSQAGQLDQVIFAGYTHEPAELLAKQLLEVTG